MALLLTLPWFFSLGFVVYLYLVSRPRLRNYPPANTGPLLSVIIPARNEEENIDTCLRSILQTQYDPIEVIVVDDCSTDGTAETVERIVRLPDARDRVRLVRGEALPPGWFGKQWALVQGYAASRGTLLLFTDADTRHGPELIPRVVRAIETERVHLLSVMSRQLMESFWERLIQPQVFLLILSRVGNLRRMNRTRVAWNAAANGQFILTTREAYQAVGKHEAVRHTPVEDIALAQTYVRHGKDIFLIHAPEYVRTRMYRSLSDIIGGWSKNLALGTRMMMPPAWLLQKMVPYLLWLGPLLWLLFWLLPPIGWLFLGAEFAILATVASLVTWVVVYAVDRVPVGYALIYPFGAIMTAFIMFRSALRGARRVEWRGRSYRDVA